MYEPVFSLANINKIVKSGGALEALPLPSQNEYQYMAGSSRKKRGRRLQKAGVDEDTSQVINNLQQMYDNIDETTKNDLFASNNIIDIKDKLLKINIGNCVAVRGNQEFFTFSDDTTKNNLQSLLNNLVSIYDGIYVPIAKQNNIQISQFDMLEYIPSYIDDIEQNTITIGKLCDTFSIINRFLLLTKFSIKQADGTTREVQYDNRNNDLLHFKLVGITSDNGTQEITNLLNYYNTNQTNIDNLLNIIKEEIEKGIDSNTPPIDTTETPEEVGEEEAPGEGEEEGEEVAPEEEEEETPEQIIKNIQDNLHEIKEKLQNKEMNIPYTVNESGASEMVGGTNNNTQILSDTRAEYVKKSEELQELQKNPQKKPQNKDDKQAYNKYKSDLKKLREEVRTLLTKLRKLEKGPGVITTLMNRFKKDGTEEKTDADTEAKEGFLTILWNKLKNSLINYFSGVFDDFKKDNRANWPTIWAWLIIGSLLLIIGAALLSFYILVKVYLLNSTRNKIKKENRLNRDLPEYLIARSNALSSSELPFNWLFIMPILCITMIIGVVIHKKIANPKSQSEQQKAYNEKCNDGDETAVNGTSLSSEPPKVPINLMSLTGLYALTVVIMISSTFIWAKKQLSYVRKRIVSFEKMVYDYMYINREFLHILYTKGVSTESATCGELDPISLAIKKTILTKEGTLRDGINDMDIIKIICTCRLYKYLQTDLTDFSSRQSFYRTDSMELFNYSLIALPEKSRIFKVADYMRAMKPSSNIAEIPELEKIYMIVNNHYTLSDSIKNKIQENMNKTVGDAFNIKAYKAWGAVQTLTLLSFLSYWIIFVSIICYKLGKRIYENFI